MNSKSINKDILYCSFNQDQSCLSVGTPNGFKIFSTAPLRETYFRDLRGGIRVVEMLYRSNILALVGGGDSPKYPLNKVMLWDDHQSKCIAEVSFKSDVKQVRLKTDKMIVSLEEKIYIYTFPDVKLTTVIETCKNPRGIFALNNDPKGTLLACPAKTLGLVSLHSYGIELKSKARGIGNDIVVKAHKSQIECMEIDFCGKRLATASEKGTIIRVFNCEDGTLIHELRRGSDHARIFSIAFDLDSKWLACSSDSLTVHVFSLKGGKIKEAPNTDESSDKMAENPKSKLSFMKKMNSYFGSEWSLAQFKVNDRKTRVTFGQESNSLYIAGFDGNFYIVNFDPVNGGECLKQFEGKLL